MLAVPYRDQRNPHTLNEFSKIGKKNFNEGEKFHLCVKYKHLVWFISIPVTEPKLIICLFLFIQICQFK